MLAGSVEVKLEQLEPSAVVLEVSLHSTRLNCVSVVDNCDQVGEGVLDEGAHVLTVQPVRLA